MITLFGCMNSKTIQNTLALLLLLGPAVTFAQFQPLVGIPGITDPTTDINTYINILYALSISIAALLAVIKIIIAGVKYMLSDIVTSKQEAKSDIQGALLGLLIVISAVLILNVINPQLTETTLFVGRVDSVPFNNSALSGGGSGPTAPAPVIPAPSKTDCRYLGAGNNPSYDCTAQEAACRASGGSPTLVGLTVNNKVECSFGTTLPISCTSVLTSGPGDPNPTYAFDCSSAIAKCTADKGTATIVGASSETVNCAIRN